jgi:hypothetical protein
MVVSGRVELKKARLCEALLLADEWPSQLSLLYVRTSAFTGSNVISHQNGTWRQRYGVIGQH